MLDADGGFFLTSKQQQEQTGMSEYQIRVCKNWAIEQQLLKTKILGLPSKEFYYLDTQKLSEMLSGKEEDTVDTEEYEVSSSNEDTDTTNNNNEEGLFQNNNEDTISTNNSIVRACHRIYRHWIKKAGHIHKARYTSTLEKVIKTKLEKYGSSKIISAIDHYVEIYDSDFYYTHDWALLGFLKQKNGLPRFVEGADEEFDGDLWKDYCRHKSEVRVAKSTTYSSSTSSTSSVQDVEKLINTKFTGILRDSFIQDCYEPAEAIVDFDGKDGHYTLADALIDRYDQINFRWEKLPPNHQTMAELGPMTVLAQYVTWLGDQEWITNRRPSMFSNDTLFSQFYKEYTRKLGLRSDSMIESHQRVVEAG